MIVSAQSRDVKNETEARTEEKAFRIEYELDAYYSNLGVYIPLTHENIPEKGNLPEWKVYRDLFLASYIPRYFVVEGSVNPMPVAGVAVRSSSESLYKKAKVTRNLNWIHAVTAGFDEPYALSFFLGNVVSFNRPEDTWRSGNFGYMGYLLSMGAHHIKDNILVDDYWYELSWKLKGDRIFPTRSLSWNFSIGTKQHSNPNIADVMFLSLKRSRLDFDANPLSFLKNSGFEYTFYFDYKKWTQIKHVFYVEKKWPIPRYKIAFTLAIGFIWESPERYTGPLSGRDGRDNFILITRPNVDF